MAARQGPGRYRVAGIAAAACLAVGLPFAGFASMVLVHFYVRGAFVLDSGLLASLIWHSDWALTQPATAEAHGSFFATHMSPIFWLADLVSWALPLTMAQFFAGFVGLSHALLAAAVFWLLVEGFGLRRGAAPWLAAAVAIGFAFSGLAIAIARYPHFETFVAAFFLLFLVARTLGHPWLAAMFLLLGLTTREDAGFHLAAVLGLFAVLKLARGERWRADAAVAGLAFGTSALMLALQHLFFPTGESAFVRVYLGDPPFAHLSLGFLAQRLMFVLTYRPYIVWPALGICLWARRTREPAILVGMLACLPWLALQLVAKNPLAGVLSSYYAFPVLIAMGWPLLVADRRVWPTMGWFIATLALSFLPSQIVHDPGRLHLPEDFFTPPTLKWQAATERAVAAVIEARPGLGRLVVDNSVAALAPHAFSAADLPNSTNLASADSVVLFRDGYDAERIRPMFARLPYRYDIPGTPLLLASKFKIEALPVLRGLLEAEER